MVDDDVDVVDDDVCGGDNGSIGGNVSRFEETPPVPTTLVILGMTSPARITTTR